MMHHAPTVKVNGDTLITCLSTGEVDQEDGTGIVVVAQRLVALEVANASATRSSRSDYAGPVPEHVLYGLPAPPFNWGAYFDRQFARAMAPNRLRPDDSGD